jgi:phosphopantetheinyl transferase
MPVFNVDKSPLMGIWKISEPWQELFDSLTGREAYHSGLNEIRSDRRKQEWLAVRLLLQHLSGKEALIRYRKNGAPFLPDSKYHISISHTQGYAALLLSKNPNPGIDIEYHSERAWRLRKKYMNESELAFITSLCDHKNSGNALTANETETATICWCAKETACKALGDTGVDFAEHFRIKPFNPSKEGILLLKEKRTEQKLNFKINYRVTEDFILTWKE